MTAIVCKGSHRSRNIKKGVRQRYNSLTVESSKSEIFVVEARNFRCSAATVAHLVQIQKGEGILVKQSERWGESSETLMRQLSKDLAGA
jgi:hypothetical protein